MTYLTEKENSAIRVVIDCLGCERDAVDGMLSRLFCDYRKSYDKISYQRNPEGDRKQRRGWYCEFYVRLEDEERLERLLRGMSRK